MQNSANVISQAHTPSSCWPMNWLTDWLSALNMYCELVQIVTVCASRQACTVACSWTRLSSVSPLGRCQLALSFTRLLSRDNHLRTSTAQQHTHLVSPISHNQAPTSYLYILQAAVKVENLRWGNSIFSVGPQPRGQGPSDADASEYSMPYLPATSNCYQLFCTDVVVCNCSVSPTVLCISTNLEMQERCLPIIRGAGTPFPCVPRHFNRDCCRVSPAGRCFFSYVSLTSYGDNFCSRGTLPVELFSSPAT